MSNVLFEIGTEELPAGFLQPALAQLKENFIRKAEELHLSHGAVRVMGTPRRLALLVENLAERQPDAREELLGPSAKAGLAGDGSYTKAATGFARSKGANIADLQLVKTSRGEYLMLVRERRGKPAEELLPEMLRELILEFSFPKSMRWGENATSFARPIQWLLALNDTAVIPLEHEGIRASNCSRGHRFMADREIVIDGMESYEDQLLDAHVVADPEKRRRMVIDEARAAVAASANLEDANVVIDENLLGIVTNLVETPFGVCGSYDEKFLALPDDVLVTSMREHQKYFSVIDARGALLPGFVAVNNTKAADTAVTRKGHERVLRARLEDALFFFNTDRETSLEQRGENLDGIIFQAQLGTMKEKNERIVKLARMLAEKFEPDCVEDCIRAARLCKADLLTDMVGEFPSLQGVMGGAYALHDGENSRVALAIVEQYMPKRAGAELPTSAGGAIVGLADRLDTVAGCFGIGRIPTGTADPFGLRRLSLAVLSLVRDRGYALSMREVVHKALALYGDKANGGAETVDAVLAFIRERYKNDGIARGYDPEAVDAVISVAFDDVNDCDQRIDALTAVKKDDAFGVLASSYKRVRNIIKDNARSDIDASLFCEAAESALYALFTEVRKEVESLLRKKEYLKALKAMLKMKEPLDAFFDDVMVMTEDATIRQNRLNLLTALGDLVLQVGDISRMQKGE